MIHFTNNLLLKPFLKTKNVFDFMDAYFVERIDSGVYAYMPYYHQIFSRLVDKIKRAHSEIGCQNMLVPSLTPSVLYERTGRAGAFSREVFTLKDRHEKRMFLTCTAEEVMTSIVVSRVKNLSHFPIRVYQISEKFRDEMRPQSHIVRSRSFQMVDAYSFGLTKESLEKDYADFYDMYSKLFTSLQISFYTQCVEDTTMLSSSNHEFVCANTELINPDSESRELEIGHIFYLGDGYARKLDLRIKGHKNEDLFIHSGSYGIGIARVMSLIIERLYKGFALCDDLQPFHAIFICRNEDDVLYEVAIRMAEKREILIDNYYSYNYEFRVETMKKLGIHKIIYEEDRKVFVYNTKTHSKTQINLQDIEEFLKD